MFSSRKITTFTKNFSDNISRVKEQISGFSSNVTKEYEERRCA